MSQGKWLRPRVSREEYLTLQRLRERQPARHPPKSKLTLGERVADTVAENVGSWRFIIIQTVLLFLWIVLNVTGIGKWDPYPFILLNLMLSFQAAYTAPIIMMSQNRQGDTDRERAEHDYQVNVKSELEVELLHDKMNLLREVEIVELVQMVKQQRQQLERLETLLQQKLDSSTATENSLNQPQSNESSQG